MACLCFRLAFNILFFGMKLFLVRIKARQISPILLIICLLLTWLGNLLIYNKKSTPQLEIFSVSIIEHPQNVNLNKSDFLLTRNEVETLLTSYAELEKNNVKSLGLYLNSNQLESIVGNEQLAQEYLDQARNIAP